MIWRLGFVVGLVAVIIGGLASERQLGVSFDGIDKLVHFAAFFALALLGALGWPARRGLFLLALPLVGVALEAAQTFSPTRSFEWGDALANSAGVGFAVAVSVAVTRWLARPERKPR